MSPLQEKETPLSSEAQDEGEEEGEGEEGEEEEEEGQDGDDVIDVSELATQTPPTAPMTTTVVIDPPEDQMHTHVSTQTDRDNPRLPPALLPASTAPPNLYTDLSSTELTSG